MFKEKKVAFYTLGCKLNFSETSTISRQLNKIGFEKIKFEEGCLSVPGFYEKVDRYNAIEYTARDINGKEYQNKCEALLAVCVQHEIDHLNGKLFVDYLSLAKRENFEKNMKKMISEGIQTKREKVPYSI